LAGCTGAAPLHAIVRTWVAAVPLANDVADRCALCGAIDISLVKLKDLSDATADLKFRIQRRNEVVHWLWKRSGVQPPAYKSGRANIPYTAKEVSELANDLTWIDTRLASHAMSEKQLLQLRKEQKNADLYAPAPWLPR
jgi:hypothetical protein